MKEVEAHLAVFWICENCGVDNFARCVTKPHNEDPDGLILSPPDTVKCVNCDETYKPITPHGDNNDSL